MRNYYIGKGQARQMAIEWQQKISEQSIDYLTLFKKTLFFYNLARRFGLVKEFKENGII